MTCESFAADAKHRATFQSPTDSDDGYGGFTRAWVSIGPYWAMITPVSGSQYFAQQAVQVGVTHKILIRYQSALKDITTISNYRVTFDDRLFAVKYVRNLDKDMKREGKDFQEFLVEENAPDASTQ